MSKKNGGEKTSLPAYEAPLAMRLDNLYKGAGACVVGSNPQSVECQQGLSLSSTCQAGAAPSDEY